MSETEWQTIVAETGDSALYINKIEETQTNFKAENVNYANLKGEDNLDANASEMNTELRKSINVGLVGLLNAVMEFDPEPYAAIYEQVKEIIKSVNDNIKLRHTLKEKEKEEAGEIPGNPGDKPAQPTEK